MEDAFAPKRRCYTIYCERRRLIVSTYQCDMIVIVVNDNNCIAPVVEFSQKCICQYGVLPKYRILKFWVLVIISFAIVQVCYITHQNRIISHWNNADFQILKFSQSIVITKVCEYRTIWYQVMAKRSFSIWHPFAILNLKVWIFDVSLYPIHIQISFLWDIPKQRISY